MGAARGDGSAGRLGALSGPGVGHEEGVIVAIPDGLVLDISEPAQYQGWEYERWLLDFDANHREALPGRP